MFTDGKVPSSTTMNCAIDKVKKQQREPRTGWARLRFAQLITWPAFSAAADRFGIPVTG